MDGEVLYATLGMFLFHLEDPNLRWAFFRAYNNWIAEFVTHAPTRLVGLGLISMHDADEAIRELKRVVSLGLKGIMINPSSPKDVPYSSRIFDKFWAVAQDVRTPVSLHILNGKERIKLGKGRAASNMKIIHEVQDSLTDIIYNGVCERYPELKLVSAENDIG